MAGRLGLSRMETEVIYCNGISYLYFFPGLLCAEGWFFFSRKGEWQSRRGRFRLAAGRLSAPTEEEADEWDGGVGVKTQPRSGRGDLSVICVKFKSRGSTDDRGLLLFWCGV